MECADGVVDPCPETLSGMFGVSFLALINTLMVAKCPINSREQYPADYGPSLKDGDEFDFIVVGAGSAGSVVASRLSENSEWRVLIIEAGTYPSPTSEVPGFLFSLQETVEDWQYKTEPSSKYCLGYKDNRCRWPRGKVLGGSSTINAMLYIRGNKMNYNGWEATGNPGWNYNSVKPYFLKSEHLQSLELHQYGRNGSLGLSRYEFDENIKRAILQGAGILGYSTVLEEPGTVSYFEAVNTIENGVRSNTGKAFLGKVKDRANLHVALNTLTERIIVETINCRKKATGVTVSIGGNKLRLKARKEVILSAGAINSPQLLMLSGIGTRNHLAKFNITPVHELKVGQNLQDHLIFLSFCITLNDRAMNPSNSIDDFYQYYMHRRGPLATIGITNLMGFINTKRSSPYPNMQFHHIIFPKNDTYTLPLILKDTGMRDEIAQQYFEANRDSILLILIPTLLKPESRGQILLQSTNPFQPPLIYPNYLDKAADRRTMLEGIRYLEKLIETKPMKELGAKLIEFKIPACKDFKFRSDEYWECWMRHSGTTVYHPVGTCKMGPLSGGSAVVDNKLRVHGVDSLRVIDASIMPDITSGNTNATTIMIGQKGATIVMQDNGYNPE